MPRRVWDSNWQISFSPYPVTKRKKWSGHATLYKSLFVRPGHNYIDNSHIIMWEYFGLNAQCTKISLSIVTLCANFNNIIRLLIIKVGWNKQQTEQVFLKTVFWHFNNTWWIDECGMVEMTRTKQIHTMQQCNKNGETWSVNGTNIPIQGFLISPLCWVSILKESFIYNLRTFKGHVYQKNTVIFITSMLGQAPSIMKAKASGI